MSLRKTYKQLTAEQLRRAISDEMRGMLKFIAKGDALTTAEGRVSHAYQTVGYAEGTAKVLLDLIGEKP